MFLSELPYNFLAILPALLVAALTCIPNISKLVSKFSSKLFLKSIAYFNKVLYFITYFIVLLCLVFILYFLFLLLGLDQKT